MSLGFLILFFSLYSLITTAKYWPMKELESNVHSANLIVYLFIASLGLNYSIVKYLEYWPSSTLYLMFTCLFLVCEVNRWRSVFLSHMKEIGGYWWLFIFGNFRDFSFQEGE